MLIYTENITPRLSYTLDFVFKVLLGCDYYLTDDKSAFAQSEAKSKICYAEEHLGGTHIFPEKLLFKTSVESQSVLSGFWKELPTIFHHNKGDIPFDIFSATFYLLSRYEEYLPHEKDEHKRFKAEDAIAFKHKFLHRPIINEWAEELSKEARLNPKSTLKYTPIITFDVDNSYAYRGKGFRRSFLACLRDISQLKFKRVWQRFLALTNIQNDPCNHYNYIIDSLSEQNITNRMFFILNGKYGKHDKNLPISSSVQQALLKRLNAVGEIGIHPSYQSNEKPELLRPEIESLRKVINRPITASRQHFLRLEFPKTYQNLIRNGILFDFTLGYAEHIGFRASTCTPFKWFDLSKNAVTELTLVPLGLMDGTLQNYLHLSPEKAVESAKKHINIYKKFNGTFVLLWHNTSFNELEGWKGWKSVYEDILAYCK